MNGAPPMTVRRLASVSDLQLEQLAVVLIDCVEGDASVSFMHPLSQEKALAFWRGVAQGAASARALVSDIATRLGTGRVVDDFAASARGEGGFGSTGKP